jgi:dTDP-4-amino-4,6-dideoxygalactose transaminase
MATPPRIPLLRPSLPSLEDYRAQLEPVWESRMLSNFGGQAGHFEELCRAYGGWAHAAAAANCDLALTLAIAALELPPGATVLLPSFTFNSTLHAALWNGLKPRFVDVDPATFCLAPGAVREALAPHGAGLIIATHIFGAACDVQQLSALAQDAGAALIFDAAHAFATFADGRHVGRFGDASTFSFSGTKLVTMGEGGVAAFADEDVTERFRYLRAYGFRRDYESRYVGLNAKLSELHAALGALTIPRAEEAVAARAALVARYQERLAHLESVRFQEPGAGVRSSCTYLGIDAGAQRDALAEHLEAANIETKAYFRPLHEMALFQKLPAQPLPVTEHLGRSALCLPLYTDLAVGDVERVCDEIERFFGSA